ncbi:MAG: ABC transporter permease subunit, partial [Elioraea sp.]|nr:ABC transporter permease subunit [Elioraea sp.]
MTAAMPGMDAAVADAAPRGPGLLRRVLADPSAAFAAALVSFVFAAALFAPLIAWADPYETNLAATLRPPGGAYWFGTDAQGRDLVVRCLYGLRLTLLIGLVSVAIGGALGILVGFLAAFYPRLDGLLMRLMDMLLSFPAILFGLALAAIFGPGVVAVVTALAIATVPLMARIVRGAALVVMKQDYIEAAR